MEIQLGHMIRYVARNIADELGAAYHACSRPFLPKRQSVVAEMLRAVPIEAGYRTGFDLAQSLNSLRPEMVEVKSAGIMAMKNFVTIGMFRLFVEDTGFEIKPDKFNDLAFHLAKENFDDPIRNVSPREAKAFIAWINEITGRNFRLPTLEEIASEDFPKNDTYRYQLTSTSAGRDLFYVATKEKCIHLDTRNDRVPFRLVEDIPAN